jgi:hypothetical protein
MPRFVRSVRLAASAAEAFGWHEREGAFERLAPPWEPPRVVERSGGIRDGDRVLLELGRGPLRLRWLAEHRGYEAGRRFRDVQVSGPFARWEHTHTFRPEGSHDEACTLEDAIDYELPAGVAGALVAGAAVRRRLESVFAYRQRTTADDLAAHRVCRRSGAVKVALTGASGLVGRALVPFLTAGGHAVTRMVRARPNEGEIGWDPGAPVLAGRFDGLEAVVHLAGENIAEGRWSAARKARIRASRADATRHLAAALASVEPPPRVFVSASAIGFYGDRGDELLDETSPAGRGYLPDVCREWEAATEPLRRAGVRVAHLRFGIVLTPAGGALARMLTPFRLGAGGPIGSGRQWWSWVALDDVLGAIHHALVDARLDGEVNVVAPGCVTNAEFARTLGNVLRRPALAPLPAFAARLAMGEMADALLLASARVVPAKLEASGYRFRHAALEGALRHLLGRGARP